MKRREFSRVDDNLTSPSPNPRSQSKLKSDSTASQSRPSNSTTTIRTVTGSTTGSTGTTSNIVGDSNFLVKQAILKDLNKDLLLRAERIKLEKRHLSVHEAGDGDNTLSSSKLASATVTFHAGVPASQPEDCHNKVISAVNKYSGTSTVSSHRNVQDLAHSKKKSITPSKIPMASAGVKGKVKKEKLRVDVKKYRPNYTWNRGGRIKELRIRCIARKYLFKWKRSVFGRVLPSVASDHYNNVIRRKIFNVWYEDWWEVRQEWRLLIRAECHYRYVLWARVIKAWKQYVIICQEKNKLKDKAVQHYNTNLCIKVLNGWKMYLCHQSDTRSMYQQAVTYRYNSLVRFTWNTWLLQLSNVDHYRQMDDVALHFWAYRITAQHWFTWVEKYQFALKQKQKLKLATQYYNRRIVKTTLQNWLLYHKQRRIKQDRKDYATKLYEISLKIRYIKYWRDRLKMVRSHQRLQVDITSLGERFQMRRIFENWKMFVQNKQQEHSNETKAKMFHKKHLLVYGLNAFRLNFVHSRIKTMRNTLAVQLYYRQVTRHFWNIWLHRCDRNEELQLLPLTAVARKHYGSVVVQKCFKALLVYKDHRIHRKELYLKADTHYYLHEMPKYLFAFKVFVQVSKIETENKNKSAQFYRENALSRFFYYWTEMTEQSQENRLAERMAFLHYEESLKLQFFNKWKLKTADILENHVKEEQATEHCMWNLYEKYFSAWRNFVSDVRKSEENELKAVEFRYQSILSCYYLKWKKYKEIRKEKARLKKKAVDYYNKKQYMKVLSHLKLSVQKAKEIHNIVETKYIHKSNELQQRMFKLWYKNAKEEGEERKKSNNAGIHYNIHVVQKLFTSWHRYAVIHAYKKSESRKLEEEARQQLDKLRVKQYFDKWCNKREEKIVLQLRIEQACQHYNNNTGRTVIMKWKEFTQISQKQKLLARQSQWFYNVRLIAKYLLLWKQYYLEAEKTHQKIQLALWHWSLSLQNKVISGWLKYVNERKHKKDRINKAMASRRDRLLRNGVTQWLMVAGDISNMRSTFAAQLQAKTAYRRFQLLQKYALHWKHKTLRNVSIRGSRSIPSIKTFQTPRQLQTDDVIGLPAGIPASGASRFVSLQPTTHFTPIDNIDQTERNRPQPRCPVFLMESIERDGLNFVPSNRKPTDDDRNEQGIHQLPYIVEQELDNIVTPSPPEHLPIPKHKHTELSPPDNQYSDLSTSYCRNQVDTPHVLHSSPLSGRQDIRQLTLAMSTLSGDTATLNLAKETSDITLLKPDDFTHSSYKVCDSEDKDVTLTSDIIKSDQGFVKSDHSVIKTNRGVFKPDRGVIKSDQGFVKRDSGVKHQMTYQEELVYIRNSLKQFDEDKKKLRKLQKQSKHLSTWLTEDGVGYDEVGELDIKQVKTELQEVLKEIEELKLSVNGQKIHCQSLVERSKIVINLIHNQS